ncbi:Peptide chain release factor 1 [Candidatus Arcanobacter lacustris]|uniref:Peptide chain release factor 1 n=1 Tax=Candidatus Arcanibacter lacustris TaxID=1607817 RepID=A0A0F5MQ45_9RICK|nr:Peptide chain release factor 1 [Candidatus Arcanobacter lacustris]
MSFKDNLNKIIDRHNELRDKLSSSTFDKGGDFVTFSKEYSDLTPIVEKISILLEAEKDLENLKQIIDDPESDSDLKEMAKEELLSLQDSFPKMELEVKLSLLPKDEADAKNAILEVRAGTGGDEAALFAGQLFRMYQHYAENKGWKFEILSVSETGIGGYKDASAVISGTNVFSKMKFESGVHRVQRVPETESSGRIHTSAATVAVLPEAEEVDVNIEEKDLRIDVFRSSGPGGQSVNTTDSAVRIVHIPSGIVVQQQDEKSQHKNKAKALKILRSKIYEMERDAIDKERAAQRKGQVGSGDRSERIRTYNFPQGRITDHRINLTLYRIDSIMFEGDLDELINALIAEYEANRLSEAL